MGFDFAPFGAIAAKIGNGGSPGRLTINGVTLTTTPVALDTSDAQFLPDGERNATNSDSRGLLLTTADIASYLSVTPESLETRVLTYRGSSYTVTRVIVQGAQSTAKLICYRTPVEGASTQDAAQLNQWNYTPPT